MFYAFDISTGDIKWSYDVSSDWANQFHGNPLVVDSLIVVGTDEGSMETGALYCFNRLSGELIWKSVGHTGLESDPAFVPPARVAVVTQDDSLLIKSLATGETEWSFASGWEAAEEFSASFMIEHPRIVSSPIVIDDKIVFVGRDSVIYAFDARTYDSAWRYAAGTIVTSHLLPVDDRIVFGTGDYRLVRLNVASGRESSRDSIEYIPLGGMQRVDNHVVFLAGFENNRPHEVAGFHLDSNRVTWVASLIDPEIDAYWYVPRIHIRGDLAVAGSTTGEVVAYDARTGKREWSTRLDGGAIRGIGHSEQMLFVGTFNGILYALSTPR